MEVQEDYERVAQWLGTIVAPEYFNAFYHKPSVSAASRPSHQTFSPPCPLVRAAEVCAREGCMHPALAPIYLDRRRRMARHPEGPILIPWIFFFLLLRHATRSSSKFPSAYTISLFSPPIQRQFMFLLFEQSDRRRQTQALGTTRLEGHLVETIRGRDKAQVRYILLRLSEHQGRPERGYA